MTSHSHHHTGTDMHYSSHTSWIIFHFVFYCYHLNPPLFILNIIASTFTFTFVLWYDFKFQIILYVKTEFINPFDYWDGRWGMTDLFNHFDIVLFLPLHTAAKRNEGNWHRNPPGPVAQKRSDISQNLIFLFPW